jgi:ribosomal protein L19
MLTFSNNFRNISVLKEHKVKKSNSSYVRISLCKGLAENFVISRNARGKIKKTF